MLKRIQSYAKFRKKEMIPTLTEAHKLSEPDVISNLISFEKSEYYLVYHERLASFLTPSEARRYLYHLILLNSKEKSGLMTIKEETESQLSESLSDNLSSPLNKGKNEKQSL